MTTATLLLPTAPFATNFVAVAPFDQDQAVSDAFASLVLVGTQPGTMVTINPTSAITAGRRRARFARRCPDDVHARRG